MNCTYCGKRLSKIERREELVDLDDDATDGQVADYSAAVESGDFGSWGVGIIEYYCNRCKIRIEMQTEELKSYNPLITNWHEKAASGDPFSCFMFEYLAFNAHLRSNLYADTYRDRPSIQRLKRDEFRQTSYLQMVKKDKELENLWVAVMKELGTNPLLNTTHDPDFPEIHFWWNTSEDEPDRTDESQKGIVRSLDDWSNMVEFWSSVRNNLFHGGKDPSIKRDCFLVDHAYQTLRAFMAGEIAKFR